MSGPAPAVAAARLAVRRELDALSPGTRVLVGCSGGADSLALAAATAFVAPPSGHPAGALVVDHGWLPGSAEVAARAAAQCAHLGLDARVVRIGPPTAAHGGPEAAARAARYDALAAASAEAGGAVVLLGHTLDDQAETVLLGLARGSGARSLAGMPRRRGIFVRPFLRLTRAETRAVCDELGLVPWDDPSNAPDGPVRRADGGPLPRAAVRAEVLPALERALGPGVPQALARTADLLRADADALDRYAAALLTAARVGGAGPGAPEPGAPELGAPDAGAPDAGALDVAVLAAAPQAVRRRALRRAAIDAGSPAGDVGEVHVAELDRLVTDYRGQAGVDLPGGRRAVRACGRLTL